MVSYNFSQKKFKSTIHVLPIYGQMDLKTAIVVGRDRDIWPSEGPEMKYAICKTLRYISMTSLMAQTVAQPTICRCLPKKFSYVAGYFCDSTCNHLIMSQPISPKVDFQSQFSFSKINLIILIFFLLKILDYESNL